MISRNKQIALSSNGSMPCSLMFATPIMYDRRGDNRITDTGGWNCRWYLMQSRCTGYLDPIGLLDMPLVRHEDRSNHVLRSAALIDQAGKVKGLVALSTFFYADTRTRELDFDIGHRRRPCLLG